MLRPKMNILHTQTSSKQENEAEGQAWSALVLAYSLGNIPQVLVKIFCGGYQS